MSEEQQSISQILRAARQARGLDIDTVYRDTSISLPVLNGMENDRFDIIEPVFSRMALLSYADYLGLDPGPLLARFDQENGPVVPPVPEATAPREAAPAGPRLPLPLDSVVLRTIGLGLGALVLLLLAISLFGDSGSGETAQMPPPEPKPAPRAQVESRPTTPAATAPEPVTATPDDGAVTPADETAPEPSAAATAGETAPDDGAVTPADETAPADAASATAATPQPVGAATAAQTAPSAGAATPEPAAGSPEPIPATAATPAGETATQPPEPIPATAATPAGETAPTAVTPPPSSADRPNDAAAPAPAAVAATTPPAIADAATAAGVVLAVEAVDSTWVQIRWDGTGKFEGIVPRGERRQWEAADHFLVLSGRAHGLRYWLGGELLGGGFLGEATKVLRFRADADGIEFLGPDFQPLTSEAAPDQP